MMRDNRTASPWKSSLVALGTAVLLTACGGVEPEVTTPEAPESSETGEVQASLASCDPRYYCAVSRQFYKCRNGTFAEAFWATTGWCIEPDACRYAGGPTAICQLAP